MQTMIAHKIAAATSKTNDTIRGTTTGNAQDPEARPYDQAAKP
jgi:hypothetical protein